MFNLRNRRMLALSKALMPIKRSILAGNRMVGIDVGSAEGMQPHWKSYEGIVDLYLFEPHPESCEKLRGTLAGSPHAAMFHVVPTALSGTGGERTLHLLNCPTGSSLYPIDKDSEFASPDNRYIYPLRETQVSTRRLAEVLDEVGEKHVDIIKLDVQGAELEILQGLNDDRRKDLILVEAEVNISGGVTRNFSPYRGAPTWTQLDEALVAEGMRLLDISVARAYRAKGGDGDSYQRDIFNVYANSPTLAAQAWEADVVYVRDWRQLVDKKDAVGVRKLVVALGGYRFFSEAYFIVERAESAGLFDPAAAQSLKNDIVAWHRACRQAWHGRGIVWGTVRRILRALGVSQMLRWKQYMWFEYPNG